MKSSFLRRHGLGRALVLAVTIAGTSLTLTTSALASSSPATLGRTGWQVVRPFNPVSTLPFTAPLGNPGFYAYIPGPIPGVNDAGWSNCGPSNSLCANSDTIDMYMPNGSRLGGYRCGGSADFTFFQSLVSIPAGTTISQFSVFMSGADDGARVSIYNSEYPGGLILPGSYIQLNSGSGSTTDLSAYMVAGEVNRVLITQVDNCAVGNNLQFAQISLNGTVVPPDTTPPTDNPVVSPVANSAGWNNSDVTVNWNWSDSGSGIDPSNCTQTSTSTGQGAITLTSTCADLAGNTASDSVTVNVDTTPPTDNPVVSPVANGAGWNNSDVTVHWNWSDSGSGIDPSNCTQTSTSTGQGAITLTSTCADLGGNTASDSVTVNVDKTAPTDNPVVSPAANGAGWNNSDVTVHWNWSDSGSGIDPSNCTQSSTSTGQGTITLSSTCADLAGNTASDSVTVHVDKTAPVVTFSSHPSTYNVAQSVAISCSASDALSGLASTTCVNLSAPAWSLGLGVHTLNATATDVAGNTGSGSTSFTVIVDENSVCALVHQFTTNNGIANSFCVKLNAASAAQSRGQLAVKANVLGAFNNEVAAQSGKGFSAAQAALLTQLASAL